MGVQEMRDWPPSIVPRFQAAVLLDRDGTLNVDTHYPHRIEELRFLPGAIEGVVELSQLPVHIVVVSNQAGIALNMYSREAMSAFNTAMRREIERAGGRIDAFYFCPHLEPKDLPAGQVPCPCSKPAPGLLLEAAQDFRFDLRRSVFVGDKLSDMTAGRTAGTHTVLIGSSRLAVSPTPDAVVSELREIVPIVVDLELRPLAAARRRTTA